MRKRFVLASSVLMFLAGPVAAQVAAPGQQMSYSYIEGGLSRVNIDPGSGFRTVNDTGFNFRGSAQFSQSVYGIGSWDRWEIGNLDADLFKLGLGFRAALSPNLDWFAEGSWTHIDIESFGTENGVRGDLGVRGIVNEWLQARAFGGYNADGPEGNSFVFGADALITFTPTVGVSLGVESYEFDVNVWRANLRLSF